jgi:hypothetical protein
MQLFDSMCWPHVNPVPSLAVGKDYQRRLLSRPRFVRACSATDFFYFNTVVNKTDTSKMSPMPLLFTRNNANSTKLNHPCTWCRHIRQVHLFSVNCDDEKWSAHFCFSNRNKSYRGPWCCTKTCTTISLLLLPAPGSWKSEDRDECITWIRFPLRIESRDIQPPGL